MADSERNEQNVIAFYDLSFNQCRPREAIERYAGEEYIQHNPSVADGRQAFIDRSAVLPWIICVMAICLQGDVFDARYLTARRRRTTSRKHEHSRHSVVDSFECPRL
jgi:hypothetical protein